jgi:hypothetical protein
MFSLSLCLLILRLAGRLLCNFINVKWHDVNKETSSHIQVLSQRGITSLLSIVISTVECQSDLQSARCAEYSLCMGSGGHRHIVDCLEFGSGLSATPKQFTSYFLSL